MNAAKVDFLNLSFKKASVDWSLFAKEVLSSQIKDNANKSWDFIFFKNCDGITVVPTHGVEILQFSGSFLINPEAFDVIKKAKTWLEQYLPTNISRIDVCRDFNLEIDEVLKISDLKKYSFSGKRKGMKPFVVGDPVESIMLHWRHKKLRIYCKKKQIERLISDKKAKKHHVDMYRQNLNKPLTRVEIELRSQHTEYANRVFADAINLEQLAKWVLDKYLDENPLLNEKKQAHKIYDLLHNGTDKKVSKLKKEKIERSRTEDLKRAASFIQNKFNKYAFTEIEALKFLLETFGFIGKIDLMYLNQELNELTFNEYKTFLFSMKLKKEETS